MKVLLLPERLKELRQSKGYTQAYCSKILGLTRNAFTNYELGIREPSLEVLLKIRELFGTTCDYLLGVTDTY